MIRDIRQDPRPGDVIQVYPPFGATPPAPLTVLGVSDRGVCWQREGQEECVSRWSVWSGVSSIDIGPRSQMALIREAEPA